MKARTHKNILFIYLPKCVNSENGLPLYNEIMQIIDTELGSKRLFLDLEETEFLSSAGLRLILGVKKKVGELKIIHVSNEVYEVFEMTGFTKMIDIMKVRRKLSLKGAKLIGEGYTAKVYRISDDTIVKVFIRDTSLDDIERELNLAKQAFVLGIPTAISYDVVEVEGKDGVVFELINCGLLRDALISHPEEFETYMGKYVELLHALNRTNVGDTPLPPTKDFYFRGIELLKERIDTKDYDEIKSFIASIPDEHSFVHGDCHIKNIMVSNSELLLIDMDTLSYGNHLFELAQLYTPYILFPSVRKGNEESFFGVPEGYGKKIMDYIFEHYFDGLGKEDIEKEIDTVKTLSHIHFMIWFATYAPEKLEEFKMAYQMYLDLKKKLTK